MGKTYKILKIIVTSATVILAIICLCIDFFDNNTSFNNKMVLSLLIMIATTSTIDSLKAESQEEAKLDIVKKEIIRELDSIVDCKIEVFESGADWVKRIDEIIADGVHAVDNVSLDSSVRSRAGRNYEAIWDHINGLCKSDIIKYRLITRIRRNNFSCILDRIELGAKSCNSFFAVYDLPSNFPFATFFVIDTRYVCTRSPYDEGQTPQYLIIENDKIAMHFQSWFSYLWRKANLITNADILNDYYHEFERDFTKVERRDLRETLDRLENMTIVVDI